MNQNKNGLPSQQFSCEICEIGFMSHAEYALHEFTKKHCDNLIRSAKNKPILKKQKTRNKILEVEKETIKCNTVMHTGSFAKYGYFVPGEIYAAVKDPKEFNSDYDPYLQKFSETCYKEKAEPLVVEEFQQQCPTGLSLAAGVSKKKKKKKSKIKTCQFCNVTFVTTPLYEAHMKSPEHILKLKVSGVGVSAHFVKASSDLHTIEMKEDKNVYQDSISISDKSSNKDYSSEFPLLNCNTSEPALSSSHQDTSHGTGVYQTDCFKKKVEKEEMLDNPLSDKLFCYTCNKLLNTVFQYNEHKQGKKHKIKCRALIRNGKSVPPEERVPGIGIPNNDPSQQPVYPELYVKMILSRQKKYVYPATELGTASSNTSSVLNLSEQTELCDQNGRLKSVNKNSGNNVVSTGSQDEINHTTKVLGNTHDQELVETTFHKINFVPANENSTPELNMEKNSMSNKVFCTNTTTEVEHLDKEPKTDVTVLDYKESLHCSVCNENFQWQFQFDAHLTNEDHLKKIVELKVSGKSDQEIVNLIFSDRNIVKPNNVGRLTCSICKVTVNSKSEFEQHLNCVVHKYSEKDYKQKKILEVRHLIPCDESGMYYCKLCKIKLSSLVEFSQHFVSVKHKRIQKRKRASRSIRLSQGQRLSQSLKRKYILLQSLKADKNPEVRTEVSGAAAIDVCTGAQSKVSNLEILEPKIEQTKNVDIEPNDKSDLLEAKNNLRKSNIKKPQNLFKVGIKGQRHSFNQSKSCPMPPSILPYDFRPQVNFSRFPNRSPYGWYPSNVRSAPPFYNSHPPVFEPFCGRPPRNNFFYRAPCFERTPWRSYP